MLDYVGEHAVRDHFRDMAALDRELARWRWFARNEHRPPKNGWRVRVGGALIRLGRRLQERGSTQRVPMSQDV